MVIQLDLNQLAIVLSTLIAGLFTVYKIVLSHINSLFAEYRRVDRELLELKAALPIDYQRRDDANRNQSVIETKIDGFALKLERLTEKLGELHVIERRNPTNG
jgi:hypothetical protein